MPGLKVTSKEFQAKFFYSAARFPAMISAWGTGKTMWAIARALAAATKVKDNLILVVRREFTDLRDSTIKDFERYTNLQLDQNKEVRFSNRSVIMFRHGAELDALKNINLGAFFMEQAEEFDTDQQFQFLRGRLRRANVPFHSGWVIANTNGHNWIWKLWKHQQLPEFELIEANTFDNADNLPKDFLEDLKRLEIEAPQVYARFVMNSWEDAEGAVWPQWNEEKHVIEPFDIPDWWEQFVALDTPVTSGIMAVGWFAVGPDGVLYLTDEYYADNKLISEHCEKIHLINASHKVIDWWADPAAFNKTREKMGLMYSVADEFRDNGIILMRAENNVPAGINRVGEYLRNEKLKVFNTCVKTREQIPQYKYAALKANLRGQPNLIPYKHEDHTCDFIRYGVMSRPQVSIIDTTPEVAVHSLEWWKRLREAEQSQHDKVGIKA